VRNISVSHKILILISFLLIFVLCVYPYLNFFNKIFIESFNLKLIIKVFTSSMFVKALFNSLKLALLVSLLCSLVATPLAWLLTRTNLKTRQIWKKLFTLSYAIPPYLGAIAWIKLCNPSNGILNNILGVNFNIYSITGLTIVLSSFFFTFILLNLMDTLGRMDATYEEAALLSGSSYIGVFFKITFPLIKNSFLSGFFLIFLSVMASFGVPAIIGIPGGIFLLTTQIYTYQKLGSLSGIYMSGILAHGLFLITFVLIMIQIYLQKKSYKLVSGKSSRLNLIKLRKSQPYINIILFILFFIIFILPILTLLISALSKTQGIYSFKNFTLDNFKYLFSLNETLRSFRNSLILSSSVTLICLFLGFIFSYVVFTLGKSKKQLINFLISLPYSTPGTVLALAIIFSFGGKVFGVNLGLYNTIGLIIISYIIKYLYFSFKTTEDAFYQVDISLIEAAKLSGAKWHHILIDIWYPMVKPAILASAFLIFLPALSELTMTILLTGPGLETIGTLLFQLQEYSDITGGTASALAIIVILLIMVLFLLFQLLNLVIKREKI